MLILAVVVAAGTLYESRYNAEVAGMIIYKSKWFQLLMGLLWINIFCAAVSRWPFKKHHTGFVITHIGLLTLLIGAQITAVVGIDGQLRIVEGESGNTVFLTKNVLKTLASGSSAQNLIQTYPIERLFDRKSGDELSLGDFSKKTGIAVDQYIPFARRKGGGGSMQPGSNNPNAINLSFRLQSQFFDVQQMLNTESNSEMQMGPATLRLVKGVTQSSSKKREPNSEKASPSSATNKSASGRLMVLDSKGQVIKTVSIAEFKKNSIKVQNSEITLFKIYQSAMVDGGKVSEQGGNANPAVEFTIKTGAEKLREISYEKFPSFSLRKNNTTGLSFKYESGAGSSTPAAENIPAHENIKAVEAPPMAAGGSGPGGNVIEFQVDPAKPDQVHVVLSKKGKQVLEQTAKAGEVITTPWMGMKITVLSVGSGGSNQPVAESNTNDIEEVEMLPKMPLPSSAIYLRPAGGDVKAGAWLVEGDTAKIQTLAGEVEVYYGMDSIELPFKVQLEKFQKVNYPGTETAMSFQSRIRINGVGPSTEIMMNEPLQYQGFTLYQSSFEQGPGIQTASIFSVNHDPGRIPKYVGAIILSLGIAIFTIMRSRWYQQRFIKAKA